MEHNEFVVEFTNGSRDWVDPVDKVWEDDKTVFVGNSLSDYTYEYDKKLIDKWIVRPYSAETTYEPIEEV